MMDQKRNTSGGVSSNAGAPELDGSQEALDPRQILRMLWRRKTVIVAFALIGTLVAALWVYQQDRQYTAHTDVMLDPRERRVMQIDEVMGEMGTDQAAIQSEIQVLTSRNLASSVVSELQLTQQAAFNPSLRPDEPSLVAQWMPDLTSWLPAEVQAAVAKGEEASEPLSPEQKFAQQKERAVDILLGKLSIEPVGRSRVLQIAVTASDPKRAAELSNAYADIYIEQQLEAKYDATERATKWLNEKVQTLKAKVQSAEEAVAQYREQAGLVQSSGDSTVTSQQLSELNSKLILAQTKRAEAEARLNQIQRLINQGGMEEAAKVLDSTLIDQLRSQRAELQRQRAELSAEYGKKHPRMVNLRAEIEDVNQQIRAEVEKILQNVRNDVEVARTREQTLQQKVNALESKTANLNSKEVRLRQLEREAEANRALYQRFLSRLKETSAQEGIQKPDARIISQASIPGAPSSPRANLIIAIAAVVSVMGGVGSAFLLEQLDNAYRSAEQTEAALGIANLSLVPLLKRRQRKAGSPSAQVFERPQSAFAEAIRSLYTGILLSDVDSRPQVIVVTSSLPQEGKTSISVALARSVAAAGNSVLLVDADLRKPRIHEELQVEKGDGLVEVLSDRVALDAVLRRDEPTGLHCLMAGGYVPNPHELLSSQKMQDFIAEMRQRYDFVIIDTPPVLAVSDTLLLARQADRSVFAVGWAVSRRESVQEGVKKLRDAGVHIAGTVLSMVDVRKHAKYSYADSGYYYGRYASYYAD